MRIYTRGGDTGQTGLPGGRRVAKSALPIAACGELDELSAAIGTALAFLDLAEASDSETYQHLQAIQADLLTIGSAVARAGSSSAGCSRPTLQLTEGATEKLEGWIDGWEADLLPLTRFVLPGGGPTGAMLHLARTVCRRAERALVELNSETPLPSSILPYMNRLSDLLFVLARWVNQSQGVPEPIWSGADGK